MALTIESIYIRRMVSLQVQALYEKCNLFAFSPYFKDTAINIEITSLAGGACRIFARVGDERAQRASEISETNNECESSVQAPCP